MFAAPAAQTNADLVFRRMPPARSGANVADALFGQLNRPVFCLIFAPSRGRDEPGLFSSQGVPACPMDADCGNKGCAQDPYAVKPASAKEQLDDGIGMFADGVRCEDILAVNGAHFRREKIDHLAGADDHEAQRHRIDIRNFSRRL